MTERLFNEIDEFVSKRTESIFNNRQEESDSEKKINLVLDKIILALTEKERVYVNLARKLEEAYNNLLVERQDICYRQGFLDALSLMNKQKEDDLT